MRRGTGVPPAVAGFTPAGIRGQVARSAAGETPAPHLCTVRAISWFWGARQRAAIAGRLICDGRSLSW
jgi:hypothetical protein